MKTVHNFEITMFWDDPNTYDTPLAELKPIVRRTITFSLYPLAYFDQPSILFWVVNVSRDEVNARPGIMKTFKDAVDQYGADIMQGYGNPRVVRIICNEELRALNKELYDHALGNLEEDTHLRGVTPKSLFQAIPHVFSFDKSHLTFILWVAEGGILPTPDNLADLERAINRNFRSKYDRISRVVHRVVSPEQYDHLQSHLLFLLDSPLNS